MTEASAAALGNKAAEHGVRLSIHAPYFISLASRDEQKRLNSLTYIRDSARGGGMDGGGPYRGASRRPLTAAAAGRRRSWPAAL